MPQAGGARRPPAAVEGCNKQPSLGVYLFWMAGAKSGVWSVSMGIAMKITQEHRSQLEEIISGIECPKGFVCYKSGFTRLGRIGGIEKDGFLECLEESCQDCQFSLPFGTPASCLCPVRIYIATEFSK